MIASIQSSERVFRAICKSNGLVRVRARATVGSSETLVFESRVPAYSNPLPSSPFGSVIATASSHVWRKLRLAIERTRTPIALASRLVVLGQRTICNLGRHQITAGKFFLHPLLKHRQEPRSGFSYRFQFSPVLRLPLVDHGNNHDSRSIGNGQKPLGEVRNVIR